MLIFISNYSYGQGQKTENIILVTLDGLRWQELFTGADPQLIHNPQYVKDTTVLYGKYWRNNADSRSDVLMPFFNQVIRKKGQVYGDRRKGSLVNLTNRHWFSYPGYNEILTGYGDERINSNDKVPNPNLTILEYINQLNEFNGKVAAFGSWDVFPYIINEERSGIPVNAGYEISRDIPLTEMEKVLNTLQAEIQGHWPTVRMDAYTHHYALEYMKKNHPRLTFIAYGETDDFAHDGRYDHYLNAAHRTDTFIKELWGFLQSDNHYKDKTTLIITTDHGRGTKPLDTWRSHGKEIVGADQVWIAFLGPDISFKKNAQLKGQFFTDQVAQTLAAILGVSYEPDHKSGEAIRVIK